MGGQDGGAELAGHRAAGVEADLVGGAGDGEGAVGRDAEVDEVRRVHPDRNIDSRGGGSVVELADVHLWCGVRGWRRGMSMSGFARMMALPVKWGAFTHMDHSVRTGAPALELVDPGGLWAYLQSHPEDAGVFGEAMMAKAQADIAAILGGYDFGAFRHHRRHRWRPGPSPSGSPRGAFLRPRGAVRPPRRCRRARSRAATTDSDRR